LAYERGEPTSNCKSIICLIKLRREFRNNGFGLIQGYVVLCKRGEVEEVRNQMRNDVTRKRIDKSFFPNLPRSCIKNTIGLIKNNLMDRPEKKSIYTQEIAGFLQKNKAEEQPSQLEEAIRSTRHSIEDVSS
jgi:hypothetical protein